MNLTTVAEVRAKIRMINNSFAFTSAPINLDSSLESMRDGVYKFKIQVAGFSIGEHGD